MSGTTRGGRGLVALGCLLWGALLVGCAGSAGVPASLPSVPVPVASTPSPSASAAAGSSASGDEAAIEAAVREFVTAVNTANRTGNPGELRRTSTPSCTCRKLIASVLDRANKSQSVVGGAWTVDSLVASAPTPTNRALATLTFTEGAFEIRDSTGRTLRSGDARTATSVVVLTRSDGRWVVSDVDAL